MSPSALFFQVSELVSYRVLQSGLMDISPKVAANIAFFFLLLAWVLVEIWKQRRRGEDKNLTESASERKSTVFSKITVLANIIISFSYLGFCAHNIWNLKIIPFESATSVVTWALASLVTVYSVKIHKRWPSLLILWWIFSGVLDSLLVSLYFLTHFKSIEFPSFLPKANIVNIASFPLSILLCFNALSGRTYNYKHNEEIGQPLLQKDVKNDSDRAADAFSTAGIWSHLIFKWLNPLFKKGRNKKLELSDIPSIPQSEAADKAASLLEESLSKHKTQASLLPNAILHAIWRPLAINAIFAGVNTIASYVGPFLITNFVNFLSEKSDNSSSHHGLILAVIFLSAKTVESLSQRQWYFGAHRLGIRMLGITIQI